MADVLYAQADDGTHVAYQILDADPSAAPGRDVVMVTGGLFPLESFEEEPGFVRLLDGLRALGRLVVFDRRGRGPVGSDPGLGPDSPRPMDRRSRCGRRRIGDAATSC